MLKGNLKKLRAIDAIIILYSLIMIVLNVSFGYRLNYQLTNVITYIGCISISIIFTALRVKFNMSIVKILSNLYPIILLIAFYEVSGFQIHIFFSGFYDSILLKIENALFTVHPTVWLQQFNHPLFTEWMMFGYSAYLLLLPFTVGWLFFKGSQKESENLVLSLLISFFICYIVFILLPVEGPRFVLADQYTVTFKGYFFMNIVELLENKAMLHGGAFPSAHCSAATVMLILSYKYDKKLYFLILPIIITLYISTMYGRYHYPLDVLAGIIAGIVGIKLSYPIEKLWGKITNNSS
ncbi:MAG: hypothetical protein B6D58_08190 [candidate division Zixibacteria bacterium 4484_95]|nr:MAG: hypothetical protein B6D58_08190 [candidate division Zixibacteria bacterium 4484_95]